MHDIKKDLRSKVVLAWEPYFKSASAEEFYNDIITRWSGEQHDEFPKNLALVYPDISFSEHLEVFLLTTSNHDVKVRLSTGICSAFEAVFSEFEIDTSIISDVAALRRADVEDVDLKARIFETILKALTEVSTYTPLPEREEYLFLGELHAIAVNALVIEPIETDVVEAEFLNGFRLTNQYDYSVFRDQEMVTSIQTNDVVQLEKARDALQRRTDLEKVLKEILRHCLTINDGLVSQMKLGRAIDSVANLEFWGFQRLLDRNLYRILKTIDSSEMLSSRDCDDLIEVLLKINANQYPGLHGITANEVSHPKYLERLKVSGSSPVFGEGTRIDKDGRVLLVEFEAAAK